MVTKAALAASPLGRTVPWSRPSPDAAERAALAKHTKITHALKDPSRALAALNRDICGESLLEFAQYVWPVLEPGREMKIGWAVEAICEHLEAVTSGDIKKLLVNVPPGMMKSLLVNVIWPAWEWGPRGLSHLRYLSSSYNIDLSIRDLRRCRSLIDSEQYQGLWGDKFTWDPAQNAKTRYDNLNRGFRIALSVDGGATGERGDRFIVDDPHNVKKAEAETDLDSKSQWFTEVAPSRVNDLNDSAFIVIMQRVHERDISGLILSADLGYEHLELPMEYESSRSKTTSIGFRDPRTVEGELLFPERFDRKGVDALKKQLSAWGGEYAVAGQLQQRPAPRGGGMFKREACGPKEDFLEVAPAGVRWVRGWDIAGSKRKTSPFTAGVKLGVDNAGTYYVAHVVRERMEIEDAEDLIVDTAHADGHHVKQSLPQDPGSAGKSQKAHMGKALDGLDFEITPESGEKADRAIPIASQWNNGNVRVIKGDWNDAFLNELATFPRGTFKDQADAFSRAYSVLVTKKEGQVPAGPREVTDEAEGAADDDSSRW